MSEPTLPENGSDDPVPDNILPPSPKPEKEEFRSFRVDWHSTSRKVIILCKIGIYCFIFLMAASWTYNNVPMPYGLFLSGIELLIAVAASFTTIRLGTNKPWKPYANKGLLSESAQVKLLLSNIVMDMKQFDQTGNYYFTGVRFYKYTTAILSGISTVLLGLNVKTLNKDWAEIYPELSKNIAFVIGAIITVWTSLMSYWNIEKYWQQSKAVVYKLAALKKEIENLDKAGKLPDEVIQQKYEAYVTIIEEYNKYRQGGNDNRQGAPAP
ncbi:hypothetical protein [Mucilaginibacter ginsenosidivorax]|uniref:DUF4231 domain-containing protein n=1 Tax=Mucilaginibacter ginsenosidivorax TaxID=862126 RepID=A0A5B8VV97_9SPHI|nr:hypothetical protein [Mucilaginibacter ginsenosidivorax]QEC74812.1 hypothetical protein FSB76_02205 [Mucilaginibacter ginsenosidivorax]